MDEFEMRAFELEQWLYRETKPTARERDRGRRGARTARTYRRIQTLRAQSRTYRKPWKRRNYGTVPASAGSAREAQ